MMIMGDICTRGCTFCNIATGRPEGLDVFEPVKVADTVQKLGLSHVALRQLIEMIWRMVVHSICKDNKSYSQ